jgi:hypothetical protein
VQKTKFMAERIINWTDRGESQMLGEAGVMKRRYAKLAHLFIRRRGICAPINCAVVLVY